MLAGLTKIALVGTAQQPPGQLPADHPLASLISQLGPLSPEDQLLLAAGTAAIYEQAGRKSAGSPMSFPAPADEETRPECNLKTAAVILQLLRSGKTDLLPDLLHRIAQAGQLLRPEVLVEMLSARDKALQAAAVPVLGSRGRWLAGFNKQWSWAAGSGAKIPDEELDSRWEEGSTADRDQVLRIWRQTDPALARAKLAEVWKQEKADVRETLLGALAENLAADDEPFLEEALDDRSEKVRRRAAELLLSLGSSELVERMVGRAAPLLELHETAGQRSIEGEPPKTFDPTWARDGLREKPPSRQGKRAWWLEQILAAVPPDHWQQQFSLQPPELIAAAAMPSSYSNEILRAWMLAAEQFADADWAAAWLAWAVGRALPPSGVQGDAAWLVSPQLLQLVRLIDSQQANRHLVTVVQNAARLPDDAVARILGDWPHPWSQEVGRAVLGTVTGVINSGRYQPGRLVDDLFTAAKTKLPPECFALAREPFLVSEGDRPHETHWLLRQVQEFQQAIELRQLLAEELKL